MAELLSRRVRIKPAAEVDQSRYEYLGLNQAEPNLGTPPDDVQIYFLASDINGVRRWESGVQGPQGIQGIQGTKGDPGPQGIQGLQGIQGIQGIQGLAGTSVKILGTVPTPNDLPGYNPTGPDTYTGDYGDGYIVSSTGKLWVWAVLNNEWYEVGNIVGPQGAQGRQGTQGIGGFGAQGTQGLQGISGTIGAQGVQGRQGTQGIQGVSGQGVQGAQGTGGLQGGQGTQGIQGFRGLQGIQGVQGRTGIQGPTGIQGISGEFGGQGTQGLQGTTGSQGSQGIQGLRGFQGIQGIQGTIGSQGTQGRAIQGTQGAIGPQGVQGRAGFQGVQGLAGTLGAQGAQGIQGFRGIQGNQGIQGLIGPQGVQGFQGTQGTRGFIGEQGVQGIQGPQGTQGTQGIQGLLGFQGVQGAAIQGTQGIGGTSINILGSVNTFLDLPGYPNTYTGVIGDSYITNDNGELWTWNGSNWINAGTVRGPQGLQGVQGTQGIQGVQGVQGPQGVQGRQGTQGLSIQGIQGVQGPQGLQGVQGVQGIQGFSVQGIQGIFGVQGTQGPQGLQGIQGVQGPRGQQGTQGLQGVQGPQGVQGGAGTSVRILGNVATESALPGYPTSYNGTVGDGYIVNNTGFLWVWSGTAWVEAGRILGPQGLQGVQGVQGIQGSQGSQGIQGGQGTQGIQGLQGPQGIQGVQGVQGLQGRQGTQGPQGLQGPQGIQGFNAITVVNDVTTNADRFIVWEEATSGAQTVINVSSTKLTFNPSTGNLTTSGDSRASAFVPLTTTVPSYGVYQPSSGAIGIATNSLQRFGIDTSGNVSVTSGDLLVATTTNTNTSKIVSGGTISETVDGNQYLLVSQVDIGTDPNQIPLNGFLGQMAYMNEPFVQVTSSTADSNVTINATATDLYSHIASFTADRTVQIANLTSGQEVRLYLRNTNASSRIITIQASETTASYANVNLAPGAGTMGATSVSTVTLAATSGTTLIWVANIDGNIVGGIIA